MRERIKLEKRKLKNKINLFGKTTDFPATLAGASQIVMYSDKEIIIDGCYGIIEYSDTFIKIKLKDRILKIVGCNFDLPDFYDTYLTVCGKVYSLEFSAE